MNDITGDPGDETSIGDEAATPRADSLDGDPADLSWIAASTELRRLVDELDDPQLDIDELAGKVERAAALITVCRERVRRARDHIATVMADFETD